MSRARELGEAGSVDFLATQGRRNLIINGGFDVWQRGTSTVLDSENTGTNYLADRWQSRVSGSGAEINVYKSNIGNQSSHKMEVVSASTDLSDGKYVFFRQIIELQDIRKFRGEELTLSFLVETNWSGNLPIAFLDSREGDGFSYVVNRSVTSGVNKIKVNFTLNNLLAVDRDANEGGLTIAIGFCNEDIFVVDDASSEQWLQRSVVGHNKYLTSSSTNWVKTDGNFINVAQVQLELGDTATPFEQRSYGEELALCQRYYREMNDLRFAVSIRRGRDYHIPVVFGPAMRVSPFVTITDVVNYKNVNNTIVNVGISADKVRFFRFDTTADIEGSVWAIYLVFDAEL